ncbi:hypothetical protein U91I_02093 [alpha proteobacterium U9-1i]|nr:hypothetical protein U91I_02093 [alpha proteobacterium U9-1i]
MPIRVNGRLERSITEAAGELGIAVTTLRNYIRREVFDPPPRVWQGSKSVSYFPDHYMARAKQALMDLRR